ncbi:MAG: DUF1161 domain-containing protein [Nitrosomonadales bacterium]|nr:DUF1161 domain-containing protein [Nitrosomonadales bacterium]
MRKLLFAACLVSFSVPAMASCDSLKAQIDARLQAKGVASYTLEVVPVAVTPATAASGAAAATPPRKPPAKSSALAKVIPSRSFTPATETSPGSALPA